ncbi:MAG: hypothetical protein HC817_03570 [Saprospiraceae bacterium]|nr:hypothetical protein [Saprospiraceae bacterium]
MKSTYNILSVLLSVLLIAGFFSINACKTEEKTTLSVSPTIATMTKLVNKEWQLVSETTLKSEGSVNSINEYGKCEQDDSYSFMPDGQFLLHDGLMKCASGNVHAGRWAFHDNDARKVDVAATLNFTAEIVEVSDETLKWQYKSPSGEGTVVQTFTAK